MNKCMDMVEYANELLSPPDEKPEYERMRDLAVNLTVKCAELMAEVESLKNTINTMV